MKKMCRAGVAENILIDLHSLNFESVAQHFQQHFYMTLKSGIHYIVYVCSFLGSQKSVAESVAQHFEQHFYMTLKSSIHYIVYVCSFLGSQKRVAESVAQ